MRSPREAAYPQQAQETVSSFSSFLQALRAPAAWGRVCLIFSQRGYYEGEGWETTGWWELTELGRSHLKQVFLPALSQACLFPAAVCSQPTIWVTKVPFTLPPLEGVADTSCVPMACCLGLTIAVLASHTSRGQDLQLTRVPCGSHGSRPQHFAPPRCIWPCLESFLIVTLGGVVAGI